MNINTDNISQFFAPISNIVEQGASKLASSINNATFGCFKEFDFSNPIKSYGDSWKCMVWNNPLESHVGTLAVNIGAVAICFMIAHRIYLMTDLHQEVSLHRIQESDDRND